MWLRLVALCGLVGIAASSPPVVDVVGLGSVEGFFLAGAKRSMSPTNISAFLGIPYAKPPTEDLRWRAPEPHGAWTSKRLDGTKYGNCCVQKWPFYLPPNTTKLSEDCLSLNVAGPTAALNGKQRLPVMFWIHGGAYSTGCSSLYDEFGLVAFSELKVVEVTINYRLNVFGFLASADLQSRTVDASTGNYGIQDQRLALQWTADHIGSFGGDGKDVTIFGESAGGSSVINHLAQKASFPLYKKAIIESGTYQGAVTLQASESSYATIKKGMHCGDVPCLLEVSADELNEAQSSIAKWGPTVDGVYLSDIPWNLIRRGEYNNKVPIMLGSNRDEMAVFAMMPELKELYPSNMGELRLDVILAEAVGLQHVQEVKKLYDPKNYPYPSDLGNFSQPWWTAIRVATDAVPGLGACGARNFSQNFYNGGSPSVFTYLFAHPYSDIKNLSAEPFSGHGSEIAFVLGGISKLTPGEETDLSIQMMRYWSNFAITGNPNSGDLPKWHQYGKEGDVVQRLQTRSEGGVRGQIGLRKEACDYWDNHPQKSSKTTAYAVASSTLVLV